MFSYKAIGLMSGTSLDGLDIAYVHFFGDEYEPSFELLAAQTLDYPEDLMLKLAHAKSNSALYMQLLDIELGTFYGQALNQFIELHQVQKSEIQFVASHGHTVFHQPEKRLTLQIGNGQEISRISGIPVICDFRSKDVLFGGQGAPLVPVGDRDLFQSRYACDAFINLGGFANISVIKDDEIRAFDICACNLLLNRYTKQMGMSYDKNGAFGEKHQHENSTLLSQLDSLDYFSQVPPKSLGTEWLEQVFLPILEAESYSPAEFLSFSYQHIASQIANVIELYQMRSVFFSGGGAKNDYLISLIQSKTQTQLIVPEDDIIDFKEAIVFAYLGLLHELNKPNCLKSVTAASKDVVGGVKFFP